MTTGSVVEHAVHDVSEQVERDDEDGTTIIHASMTLTSPVCRAVKNSVPCRAPRRSGDDQAAEQEADVDGHHGDERDQGVAYTVAEHHLPPGTPLAPCGWVGSLPSSTRLEAALPIR